LPEENHKILEQYPELAIGYTYKRRAAAQGGRDYIVLEPSVSEVLSKPKVKKVAFKLHYHYPVQHAEMQGLLRLQQNCRPEDISKAQEESEHILRVFNKLHQMLRDHLNLMGTDEDFFCAKPLTQIEDIRICKPSVFLNKVSFDLETFLTSTGDILIEIGYGYLRPHLETAGRGSLVGINFQLCPKKDQGPTVASENRKRNQKRDRDELPPYMVTFFKEQDQGKNIHVNMLDILRTHLPLANTMLSRIEEEMTRRTLGGRLNPEDTLKMTVVEEQLTV